ncbi:TonB-dependent receptor domain-containing protein [Bacteroidota bacterium]
MRKRLIVYLLFLCGVIYSQDITVSGIVSDAVDNTRLPFATITLENEEGGALIAGTVGDSAGVFSITGTFSGEYIVTVTYVGYKDEHIPVLIGELNRNFDLGRIRLMPSVEDLEEVSVSAIRDQVSAEMDRKVFSISDLVAQTGASVLDAMKSMPGVTVDQDGKVILRGSDKVVIMIDGKQSSLTGFGNQKGLDNLPAANIDKIEIINNPSAKYAAGGMAGIINIVYKKQNKEGLNGDLGFAYGIGALTKPRQDLPTDLGSYAANSKYIPSLNMNFRRKKMNIFLLGETMVLNQLPNNEFTTRYYDDGRITASQVPENRTQQHHIVNGGVEYRFNDRNSIVLEGIYDWEKHVDTAQVTYIDMLADQRYRYITWHEEEITGFMNYAANYKHSFYQPGHELEASAQYTRGWEDETYFINDSSGIREGRDMTNILAIEHIGSIQADYTRPMKHGRLETGALVRIRRLPVEYTVVPGNQSIIYPGMGNRTDWGEDLYAGYANFVHERKRLDIETGLRAEYTGVNYTMDPGNIYYNENDAYDYFKLFPNLRFSFKPNPNHRISAFYNRRIDRPGEPELRIFAKSDDHELLKVGNPYLRPQFTSSYELAYRYKWKSGMIYLAGYCRLINDPYMRIYTADTSNAAYDVIVKIYANTGSATNSGLELVFSQQVLDFWKLSGNTNLYKNTIDAYVGDLRFPYIHTFSIAASEEYTWDVKVNNQFYVSEQLEILVTGIYMAPKNIPQGKQYARSSIDLSLSWKLLEGRGSINISATDILNTYGIRQDINGVGFRAEYENYYETQVFRLGVKYRF